MAKNWAVAAVLGEYRAGLGSLKFRKTGKEIRESIGALVPVFHGEIRESEARIKEICTRREVKAEEVVGEDAAETRQKVGMYSTSNAHRYQGLTALEKFNEDMEAIRSAALNIEAAQSEIQALTRVHNNLEPERSFDLGLDELGRLGF